MAGFRYGYGYPLGGSVQQSFEQERIGYGPQGYGLYEQDAEVSRNPFTGATIVQRENEFIPMGGYGGYGIGLGNRFF